MRYVLLPVLFIGLMPMSHAQIPNGGFESWYSNVNYMEPTAWWTSNMVTYAMSGAASCVPGAPGAVGNYHMEITSMNAGNIVEIGRATCGNEATGQPGFPYAARPTHFTGQVQYAPQGGDVGQVHAALWGWNSQMTGREVIGVATYNITTPIGAWQSFSVPFTYFSANMPDTAKVFLNASGNTPVHGTVLRVDDLAFSEVVGLEERHSAPVLSVFPSPATDLVTIVSTEWLAHIAAFNVNGQLVWEQGVNGPQATMDIAAWPSGVYALRCTAPDGRWGVHRVVRE